MKRIMLSLVVLSVAAGGCATKKYVSQGVGDVNQKVDTLSGEVEKTQARVKTNEGRIDSVDQQSKSGIAPGIMRLMICLPPGTPKRAHRRADLRCHRCPQAWPQPLRRAG